jgi:translin
LDAAHRAREAGLTACRRTIRASSQAIKAVHRQLPEQVAQFTADARAAIREAQEALRPHPAVAFAGFLHDAEKEYAEAVLTACLVGGEPLPDAAAVGVEPVAWLCGLCEAASELRRHLLDRLREGESETAEHLLRSMEDVYDLLVTVDYPDALTGGLRRITDSLRAVLERSRADLTTTMIQVRLQRALQERAGEP